MRGRLHNIARPGHCPGLLRLLLAAWACVLMLTIAPALAQESRAPESRAIVPVLTLDWEQLFDSTLWGERIKADLTAASRALNAENNRIADDLVAEEKALTERRAGMDPKAFRTEADAFDERATGIRNAQKAKAQALTQSFEAARAEFFNAVAPLLDEMLARRGAAVVLDRRVIIRGLAQADITPELSQLVDAKLGSGPASTGLSTVPAPEAAPGTAAPAATPNATAAPAN